MYKLFSLVFFNIYFETIAMQTDWFVVDEDDVCLGFEAVAVHTTIVTVVFRFLGHSTSPWFRCHEFSAQTDEQ